MHCSFFYSPGLFQDEPILSPLDTFFWKVHLFLLHCTLSVGDIKQHKDFSLCHTWDFNMMKVAFKATGKYKTQTNTPFFIQGFSLDSEKSLISCMGFLEDLEGREAGILALNRSCNVHLQQKEIHFRMLLISLYYIPVINHLQLCSYLLGQQLYTQFFTASANLECITCLLCSTQVSGKSVATLEADRKKEARNLFSGKGK